MRKIICDKCLKELAPFRPERFGTEVKLPTGPIHIDLCERCATRLKAWCETADDQAAA